MINANMSGRVDVIYVMDNGDLSITRKEIALTGSYNDRVKIARQFVSQQSLKTVIVSAVYNEPTGAVKYGVTKIFTPAEYITEIKR